MAEQRLMLRAGYAGRGRRLENGGDCPPGEATAEMWRILTDAEPPAVGAALACSMLVAGNDHPDNLIRVARAAFSNLVTTYPQAGYDYLTEVACAVDAGGAALYLLDCWYIASAGITAKAYKAARREVGPGRKPLIAAFVPVRPRKAILLP